MKTTNRQAQTGFTLLEILLVVVIIGMLVGVAAVKIGGKGKEAKITATHQQIDAYKSAIGLFELDTGNLPTTDQGMQALITQPGGSTGALNWKGPYLEPAVIRKDHWGHEYIYRYPGQKNPSGYDLSSPGPNGIEGDDDDIGNWM